MRSTLDEVINLHVTFLSSSVLATRQADLTTGSYNQQYLHEIYQQLALCNVKRREYTSADLLYQGSKIGSVRG